MKQENIEILNNFGIENIPDLDVAVLGALELFASINIPTIELQYKRPLVVGSGNALATGKIIFRDFGAVFASESDFEEKLEKIEGIDGLVIISSSGGKHAPIIAKTGKKHKKKLTLITNTPNSSAKAHLDPLGGDLEYIFPKNREPYSYNTSTYLSMILAHTKESPKEIYDFIKNEINQIDFSKLGNYNKFFLIIPPQFSGIIRMLQLKFTELFGRNIAYSIETSEYIKHTTTVAPARELFISFGEPNRLWGEPNDRIFVPLPEGADYGAMMAVGYIVMGEIQKRHPPYFKENIVKYLEKASKIFSHEIKPILE